MEDRNSGKQNSLDLYITSRILAQANKIKAENERIKNAINSGDDRQFVIVPAAERGKDGKYIKRETPAQAQLINGFLKPDFFQNKKYFYINNATGDDQSGHWDLLECDAENNIYKVTECAAGGEGKNACGCYAILQLLAADRNIYDKTKLNTVLEKVVEKDNKDKILALINNTDSANINSAQPELLREFVANAILVYSNELEDELKEINTATDAGRQRRIECEDLIKKLPEEIEDVKKPGHQLELEEIEHALNGLGVLVVGMTNLLEISREASGQVISEQESLGRKNTIIKNLAIGYEGEMRMLDGHIGNDQELKAKIINLACKKFEKTVDDATADTKDLFFMRLNRFFYNQPWSEYHQQGLEDLGYLEDNADNLSLLEDEKEEVMVKLKTVFNKVSLSEPKGSEIKALVGELKSAFEERFKKYTEEQQAILTLTNKIITNRLLRKDLKTQNPKVILESIKGIFDDNPKTEIKDSMNVIASYAIYKINELIQNKENSSDSQNYFNILHKIVNSGYCSLELLKQIKGGENTQKAEGEGVNKGDTKLPEPDSKYSEQTNANLITLKLVAEGLSQKSEEREGGVDEAKSKELSSEKSLKVFLGKFKDVVSKGDDKGVDNGDDDIVSEVFADEDGEINETQQEILNQIAEIVSLKGQDAEALEVGDAENLNDASEEAISVPNVAKKIDKIVTNIKSKMAEVNNPKPQPPAPPLPSPAQETEINWKNIDLKSDSKNTTTSSVPESVSDKKIIISVEIEASEAEKEKVLSRSASLNGGGLHNSEVQGEKAANTFNSQPLITVEEKPNSKVEIASVIGVEKNTIKTSWLSDRLKAILQEAEKLMSPSKDKVLASKDEDSSPLASKKYNLGEKEFTFNQMAKALLMALGEYSSRPDILEKIKERDESFKTKFKDGGKRDNVGFGAWKDREDFQALLIKHLSAEVQGDKSSGVASSDVGTNAAISALNEQDLKILAKLSAKIQEASAIVNKQDTEQNKVGILTNNRRNNKIFIKQGEEKEGNEEAKAKTDAIRTFRLGIMVYNNKIECEKIFDDVTGSKQR